MNYSTRPYSEQDYEFVWNLHMEANRDYIGRLMNVDEETVRKAHNARINDSEGFIIEINNQIIGCYFILEKPEYYELGRFFLVPEQQNKGLGAKIVHDILDKYKDLGKSILIHVWKDNPVQNFWKKRGFAFYQNNDPFIDMLYSFGENK